VSVPYAEVIGDPIAHSKSPLIHKFWLEKLGIPGDYRRSRVSPADLWAYLAERRTDPDWRGCNVTAPLKQKVQAELDSLDSLAAAIGAVNTLYRDESGGTGTNTDAEGFSEPLREVPLAGRNAVLFGTGGAARAVLYALAARGIGGVTVVARSPPRASELLRSFHVAGTAQPFEAPLPPADLVINATPLGMHGRPPLPVDLRPLPAHALVYDLVYAPLETELLRAARARGLATVDGLAMLIGQAARAFELFFGAAAPREHDRELRAMLTR
jgi:shikimate dehydrogenase